MKLRFLDYIAFLTSAAVLAFVFTFAATGGGDSLQVRIESENSEWVYPLDTEVDLRVPGPLGHTHVYIHDGEAGVSASPCTEKVCIATSPIERAGNWVACLPNRVFIRIEGVDLEEGIDAGTY